MTKVINKVISKQINGHDNERNEHKLSVTNNGLLVQ